MSQRKDFAVISGDDAIDFPMLVSGAKGIISVTKHTSKSKICTCKSVFWRRLWKRKKKSMKSYTN